MTDFTLDKLTPKGFKTKPLDDGNLALYHTVGDVIYLGIYSVAGKHIGGHKF